MAVFPLPKPNSRWEPQRAAVMRAFLTLARMSAVYQPRRNALTIGGVSSLFNFRTMPGSAFP